MADLFFELFGQKSVDDTAEVKALIDGEGKTEAMIQPMNVDDRVRASGIEDFCPRFEALRSRDSIVLRERVTGRLNRIFDHGRIFERALRDQVFGPLGVLIGCWRCKACSKEHGKSLPRLAVKQPKACQCGCAAFDYVEPSGMIDGTNVGGSGDGIFVWKGEECLLEIKTCKSEFFKEVEQKRWPFPRHFSQTQVYLEAFGLRKSLHWYYNKNTSEHLPIWTVKSDEAVKKLIAKGSAFKDYFKTGILPDRVCSNSTCSRAKECVLRGPCFDGP